MKAPDKIYIPFVDLGEDGLCQAPIWWDKNKQDEKPECKGTIEYIRMDALLEWAKEKKKQLLEQESENDEPSDVAAGINAGLDMLIGKLNSM